MNTSVYSRLSILLLALGSTSACSEPPTTGSDATVDAEVIAPSDLIAENVIADIAPDTEVSFDASVNDHPSMDGAVDAALDVSFMDVRRDSVADARDVLCERMPERDVAPPDLGDVPSALRPPRLVFPPSVSRVTSQRPTLRWELPPGATGARIELCSDRACTRVIQRIDATGTSVRPERSLPPGVAFWRAVSLQGAEVGTLRSTTWEFGVRHRDSPVDTAWGTLHDFNGDGYDDVVVGANFEAMGRGRFYVHNGGPEGLSAHPAQIVEAPADARPNFGSVLQIAGDVNGDGFADVLAARDSPFPGLGRFYLYLGSSSGLSFVPDFTFIPSDCPIQELGAGPIGDVNGDGFSDLAMSRTPVDIYLGGSIPSSYGSVLNIASFGAATFCYPVGDLNGDGFDDLAQADRDVQFHRGSERGPESTPWFESRSSGMTFPSTAGDFNGDQVGDLMASSGARITILQGSRIGIPSVVQTILEPEPSGFVVQFGFLLFEPGDQNGDGYPDLIVASRDAPYDRGVNGPGRAYVYPGSSIGFAPTPSITLQNTTSMNTLGFGTNLVSSADVNGDGWDDVVISACCAPDVYSGIFVYFGSSTGVPPVASQVLLMLSSGQWGAGLALNFLPQNGVMEASDVG